MSNIAELRAKSLLNKVFSYPEGIMTRREWLEMQKNLGKQVVEDQKPPVKWDRTKFNRMNREQQKEYERKLDTLVPCYKLQMGDGTFYEITKTEYEYFNQL